MKKIKTFWLNIGALDKDMDLTGRQQILNALSQQNIEVHATFNYIKNYTSLMPGIDKIHLLKIGGLFSNLFLWLRQQILLWKSRNVDFIILRSWKFHETLPLFFFLRFILQRQKPKFVLDLRTVPVDVKKSFIGRLNKIRFDSSVRLALKLFDGLTVISEKLKQDIIARYKCPAEKITVWTTGVNPEHFNPKCVGDLRQELKISNRFVLMYHGVFSPFRGIQEAIKAIAALKDKYPDMLLILLGKGDGKPEFEKLIEALQLQNHVYIHPPIDFKTVPQFLNTADCGILPFPDLDWWNTSGPLKLNEYLAMGKPVILTEIAAHRAVIHNEPFGFYSIDEKPENLIKAIESAYLEPNRSALGKSARDFAVKNLTWSSQAKKIERFFYNF